MKTATKNFNLQIISFAAVFSIGAWLIAHYHLRVPVPMSYWICISAIMLLTLIVHAVLKKANQLRPALFVAYFMGSLTVKLLFTGGLMIAVGLIDRPNLAFTAIGSFLAYATFTILEISSLIGEIRRKEPPIQQAD